MSESDENNAQRVSYKHMFSMTHETCAKEACAVRTDVHSFACDIASPFDTNYNTPMYSTND
jgi:hypothetical protein